MVRNQLVLKTSKIRGNFKNKHILSVDQFERKDLDILFKIATKMKKRSKKNDLSLLDICKGKVMAIVFFEPSTRTDLSHQAAMRRLGGEVIAASNGIAFSSTTKGENLADTVRAIGSYADVLVMRSQHKGDVLEAAYYLNKLKEKTNKQVTIINAGDGTGEHPTQALLDEFTIKEFKGTLDGLNITMVGDLKNGRTVHSLTKLISKNSNMVNFSFVSPSSLKMPNEITFDLRSKNLKFYETEKLEDVLSRSDVIYWTRIQKERFKNEKDYEAVKDMFIMTPKLLSFAKKDAILMHPLPRKDEMGTQKDHDILDEDPRSIYFQQMENGMYVRMALLALTQGNY